MLKNSDGTEHGDVSQSQSGKKYLQHTEEKESISGKSNDSNFSSINDFSSLTTCLIVKELELRKRQAEIEAELEILNLKREATEAEAECHILESTMRGASPALIDHVGPETYEHRPQQTTASGSVVHYAATTSRESKWYTHFITTNIASHSWSTDVSGQRYPVSTEKRSTVFKTGKFQ